MGAFTPKPKPAGKREPPKAWSYSRWSKYDECPLAFYLGMTATVKEPPNAAMVRGTEIHAEGERYIKGEIKDVPESFAKFKKELIELRKRKAVGEEEWAFTINWEPTGWFSENCWVRMKTDVHAPLPKSTMIVVDYKSGKVWGTNHQNQLELFALGAMKIYEGIAIVKSELWYLDQGVTIPRVYLAKDEKRIQARWENRIAEMMCDTRFDPKPGPYCKRCNYGKSKGGVCEFG